MLNKVKSILVFQLCLLAIVSATAQVRLPRLIRDSMVLQRDAKVRIWGWASPGEKVQVTFKEKKIKTAADKAGKWFVELSPMKAGGPYDMHIDASNHVTITNILIGDVWICSGQSNMVHQMELHSIRYADEIATANYPQIRHFWIPTMTDLQGPHDDLPTGYWKSANPTDVRQFSAVAYFFAKVIYQKYHVPIGLINASVGGTPIEAWISEQGLQEFPGIRGIMQKNKDTAYVNGVLRKVVAYNLKKHKQLDKGLIGDKPWYDT